MFAQFFYSNEEMMPSIAAQQVNNILQAEAEKLSGFTPSTYNPRPQAEGCMRGVKPDNFEAEACNIFKFFQLLSSVIEAL